MNDMMILNFSHPLTEAQQEQIEALAGDAVSRVIAVQPQFDEQQPFAPQLEAMMAAIDLAPDEWQTAPILVLLPSLNFIAGLLLAELHGRMGYFPPVLRTRAVAGAVPRRYEVAEIIDLQQVREAARRRRGAAGEEGLATALGEIIPERMELYKAARDYDDWEPTDAPKNE